MEDRTTMANCPSGVTTTGPMPPPGARQEDDPQRMAKQAGEQMTREARELKESGRQAASAAAEKARDAAAQTKEQLGAQARRLTAQVKEQTAAAIGQQKSRAADLINDCVAATRRAAAKLHDENDHNLGDVTDVVAERMDSMGRYLRERDPRGIADDAADLARRRPEWVLGGAFVVGLALARFLKASRPDGAGYGSYRFDGYDDDYEGAGYGEDYDDGSAAPAAGAAGFAPSSATYDEGYAGAVASTPPGPTPVPPPITTTAAGSWAPAGSAGSVEAEASSLPQAGGTCCGGAAADEACAPPQIERPARPEVK